MSYMNLRQRKDSDIIISHVSGRINNDYLDFRTIRLGRSCCQRGNHFRVGKVIAIKKTDGLHDHTSDRTSECAHI